MFLVNDKIKNFRLMFSIDFVIFIKRTLFSISNQSCVWIVVKKVMDRKVLFSIVVALLALAGVVLARNDLIVGSIRVDSVLLYQWVTSVNVNRINLILFHMKFSRQTHNQTGVPGAIISNNVVFVNQIRNISRIRALDLNSNGTGGFASIVSGGVGFRNVTINLRASGAGRGYNFFVDIYGN